MHEEASSMSVPAASTTSEQSPTEITVTYATTGTGLDYHNAAAAAAAVALSSQELPDTKEGIEELCPVCGDKVSGYHYGLLTCESCKGFFKRTVQNKKVYTCVADRSCHIDKTQRKRCPFCRFQKCLEVGMKLEAVRADRMRGGRNKFGPMYKRDRARKLQLLRQRQMTMQQGGRSQHPSQAMLSVGNEAVTLGYGGTSGGTTSAAFTTATGNNLHIKQEIQIPQVSSLTSSPDSSPSPISVQTMQGLGGGAPPTPGTPLPNGPSSLLSTDTKLWSNQTPSSPHSLSPKSFHYESPGAGSNSGVITPNNNMKLGPLIRDIISTLDDKEWQNSLFGLLQNQTYNQCEVDLFELMCKVLDQNLFAQVDWARNSCFFKELKVDDQMKLLQHSWSDMLVLDHLHQRLHNNLPDETTLPNGQKFNLLALALLGLPEMSDQFVALANKLQDLKFDLPDYICLKFILLLNPEVKGLVNRRHIMDSSESVQQALLEYDSTCFPHMQDKFAKLLAVVPELHQLAHSGEEFLYFKHMSGSAPNQTLLMEMLHAKKKV